MKILITGGAGYIGSLLTTRLLESNHQVTVLDNLYYNTHGLYPCCFYKNFDFVLGDVRDQKLIKDLVRKHDLIIALAAIVGVPACDKDKETAKAVNFQSIKFLNKIRSLNQPIIYPCTNSGYGTKSSQVYCTEETPLEPISLYGSTKVEAEKVLLDNPNSISLRFSTLFGVSNRMRLDLLVNDFTYRAVFDGSIVLYEADFTRNYLHVRDAVFAFEFAIDNFNHMQTEAYNVGLSDANLSKRQLTEKIQQHIPQFYVHTAEFGSDPDKRNYIVSNAKIEKLGFQPQYTLDQGIRELIKCYKMMPRISGKNY